MAWKGSKTLDWPLARWGAPQPLEGFQSGSRPERIIVLLNSIQGWNCKTGSIRSRLSGSYAGPRTSRKLFEANRTSAGLRTRPRRRLSAKKPPTIAARAAAKARTSRRGVMADDPQ